MTFMADVEESAADRNAGKTSEMVPYRVFIGPAPLHRPRSPVISPGQRRADARAAGFGR